MSGQVAKLSKVSDISSADQCECESFEQSFSPFNTHTHTHKTSQKSI